MSLKTYPPTSRFQLGKAPCSVWSRGYRFYSANDSAWHLRECTGLQDPSGSFGILSFSTVNTEAPWAGRLDAFMARIKLKDILVNCFTGIPN